MGDLVIPEGVETISYAAFGKCTGLEGYTVTLPDSLVLVDIYAFQGRTGNLDIIIKCNPGTYAEKWAKENGFYGKIKIDPVPDQTYTGKAIKPEVKVYHGEKLLVKGVDYKLTYGNNVDVKDKSASNAPYVMVQGLNNYSGNSRKITFSIVPMEISDDNISAVPLMLDYNGNVRKPAPTIQLNGTTLAKKNYTLSYPDTEEGAYKEAGVWNITVTGKGNYTGSASVTFRILEPTEVQVTKLNISKIKAVKYEEGKPAEPKPVIKYNGATLVEDQDYSLTYTANEKAGTAKLTITGLEKDGEISVVGTITKTFTIKGTAISTAAVSYQKKYPYTGEQITPEVTLTVNNGKDELRDGTDYSVNYGVNTKAGKGTITITGMGGYTGTVTKNFTIQPVNLSLAENNVRVELVDEDKKVPFVLSGATPEVKVFCGENELEKGTDYTVSYANHKKIKGASEKKAPTVTVTGKGNYKGTASTTFTIVGKDLTDSGIVITAPDKVYNAKGKYKSTPVVTDETGKKLTAGTHYKVVGYYVDDELLPANKVLEVGTEVTVKVEGIGSYQKEIEATYRIVSNNISKATFTIQPVEYTGDPITFTEEDFTNGNIKVTGPKGVGAPVYGEDFIISGYKSNTNKGIAQVTFKGISDEWGGSKTVKFTIKVKKMK